MRYLILCAFLVLTSSGCLIETHIRDEATIKNVKRTIEARASDYARWQVELKKADPAKRDLAGIQALQDSEMDRLAEFYDYENSKQNTK